MQTKFQCVLIHIWIKGEVGAIKSIQAHPVKYSTERSKAVLLLRIFYVFLSCVCYAFVRVHLYVPCGHLRERAYLLALVCGV